MLKRKTVSLIVLLSIVVNLNAEIKKDINHEFELIKEVIPNTKIMKYKKSMIDGFYNVYFENGQIIYVNPYKKMILFGEGITVSKEDSVIAELKKNDEVHKEWNKTLVKNGVKYGKGGNQKYKVIVVESPTCPYCRKLNKYLSEFDNTTYKYYSNEAKSIDVYKNKYKVKNPKEVLKIQGEILKNKINGIGVPFGIVIDENSVVVDTILGFSSSDKTNIGKWNKYLK
ncbi:thioredoxin fold domain-containing protein [Poseidonibacter ostreae]|uniref:thioredoxin fold domain-containing protein n=1 Tax=Poseidonibacter ostreae TaxID=2654171 RepID=UPI0012658BE5|nr:thioredoxin fold domain-containing protein [Poseidonibacter ostreae]KAB7885195.1 thioredoxin fold domain-containing protein [Poseidonibacter ostreae]